VEVLPLIGGGPRAIALLRQWVRRRAQPEDVEQDRLAVAFPAVAQEAGAGLPSHREDRAAGGGPRPVDPLVEVTRELADLSFVLARLREVAAARQHARDEDRGVDHRQLAVPGTPSGLQVEKVIVEAAMPGGFGLLALGAVAKESQHRERSRGG